MIAHTHAHAHTRERTHAHTRTRTHTHGRVRARTLNHSRNRYEQYGRSGWGENQTDKFMGDVSTARNAVLTGSQALGSLARYALRFCVAVGRACFLAFGIPFFCYFLPSFLRSFNS